MRAKLVVDPLMGAFAQQIQVEVRQHRRKPVGVVEIDDMVAEAGPQLVALRSVRHRAGEQAGIVDAGKRRRFPVLADGLDIGGLRQERAHDMMVALGVKSEIAERVGVAAFHDRIGLRGKFRHEASLLCSDRIRSAPVSGTRSQSGR